MQIFQLMIYYLYLIQQTDWLFHHIFKFNRLIHMIAVFKTNILNKDNAEEVIKALLKNYQNFIITVDLEDCDKVLRVEGSQFEKTDVLNIVIGLGFHCEEMQY